jgi:hypothetical protein
MIATDAKKTDTIIATTAPELSPSFTSSTVVFVSTVLVSAGSLGP